MAIPSTYAVLFLVVFVGLPLYVTFFLKTIPLSYFFVFTLLSAALALWLWNRYVRRSASITHSIDQEEERSNLARDRNMKERMANKALREKILQYSTLKQVIEEINRNVSLDFIAEYLVSYAFSAVGRERGVCVLYLIDSQKQKLYLFKTKKEDKKLVIKSKEGDIFDLWVIRHLNPLRVEDTHNDFRFDFEKVHDEKERRVGSLISAPLVIEKRLVGLLRLDNSEVGAFTQDDLRLLVTLCDVGAVALENAELFFKTQELAIHDGLTGLLRKGYFLERLKQECRRTLRQNRVFSLLMIDIDFFKRFNDSYGHPAGDIVLKSVGELLLKEAQEKSALVCRFGGEEFCVLLLGESVQAAVKDAERIRTAIGQMKVSIRQEQLKVTVSIGVAGFPDHGRDETEVLMRADKALYEAKRSGRNKVVAEKG